jgi:hypothetical protein
LFVLAALTSYAHGLVNPMIVGVLVPGGGEKWAESITANPDSWSGFVSAKVRFVLGNHWRVETGTNLIFGQDPYVGLGLFRDRDEVYGKVAFQF